MNDEMVTKQISQMADFILAEAEGKVDEIRVKTAHEFEKELAKKVQDGRVKLQMDYERKKKTFEVKKQIAFSTELNRSRLRLLEARSQLVKQVEQLAHSRLEELSKAGTYKDMLKNLLVQSFCTLLEPKITVRCRKSDLAAVKAVLEPAKAEFTGKLNNKFTFDSVTIDESDFLPEGPSQVKTGPSCCGGIIVSALAGRVVCDNTLDSRLRIAFESNQPEIRTTLFGASETRKFFD